MKWIVEFHLNYSAFLEVWWRVNERSRHDCNRCVLPVKMNIIKNLCLNNIVFISSNIPMCWFDLWGRLLSFWKWWNLTFKKFFIYLISQQCKFSYALNVYVWSQYDGTNIEQRTIVEHFLICIYGLVYTVMTLKCFRISNCLENPTGLTIKVY